MGSMLSLRVCSDALFLAPRPSEDGEQVPGPTASLGQQWMLKDQVCGFSVHFLLKLDLLIKHNKLIRKLRFASSISLNHWIQQVKIFIKLI